MFDFVSYNEQKAFLSVSETARLLGNVTKELKHQKLCDRKIC